MSKKLRPVQKKMFEVQFESFEGGYPMLPLTMINPLSDNGINIHSQLEKFTIVLVY